MEYTITKKINYKGNLVAYEVVDCHMKELQLTKEYVNDKISEGKITNARIINDNIYITNLDAIETIDTNCDNTDKEIQLNINCIEEEFYEGQCVLGFIEGYFDEPNVLFINYIETTVHGCGVGNKIYNEFVKYINSEVCQVKEVQLYVVDDVATLFWKSLGFKLIEYCYDDPEMPEKALMSKKI